MTSPEHGAPHLIAAASWVGLPEGGWPGFDLDFGPVFWGLLPAFVFVTLVGAIETVGDGIAIQRVSWRKPRAVDFRAVQGAVSADGVGNLFSGLMGTVPNTTYSTSISVTALTGVGARSVGIALGVSFVVVAFIPKALAVVLAIPGPVAAAYITVLLGLLFVVGMRIVIQDGIDYRKGLIAGVSFWIGVGFQNGVVFPEHVSGIAGGLLENGMTAGGMTATDDAPEREVSLRLLRHLASSVHHQQYHDTDIVTIRVDARAARPG